MKKETYKINAKRPHWQHQGKYGPNCKGNDTITTRPDTKKMSVQRIRRKKLTTYTNTKKNVTSTIKREEKVGQYLMEIATCAESRGTSKQTAGKKKKCIKETQEPYFRGRQNVIIREGRIKECGVHDHQYENGDNVGWRNGVIIQ